MMRLTFLTDILMSADRVIQRTDAASIWKLRHDVEALNFSAKGIETRLTLEGTISITYEELWIKFIGAKMSYLRSYAETELGFVRAHGDNCHNI